MSNFVNYWRRLKLLLSDIRAYFGLAFSGNQIRHMTDFSKPDLKPVLLIHGFGTTRKSVGILEKRLRQDGFDVFSIHLGGFLNRLNTRGIDDLAKIISKKIEALSGRYHIGKITVIGHSKGGLIGRYYVSCLGGDKHVKTLITLGTPHRGSNIAILATLTIIGIISKSVWQMLPRSRFIRKLNETVIPASVKVVSLYSDSDSVISKEQSRLVVPAGRNNITNVELHGYTHTDYLIKRGVYEEIRKYL